MASSQDEMMALEQRVSDAAAGLSCSKAFTEVKLYAYN